MNKIYNVSSNDYGNAGKVSSEIKKSLKELGLSNNLLRRIAVASYEAEINLVIHSMGGTINFTISDDGLIKLLFEDIGPGIKDIDQALTPGYSTACEEARQFGFGAGMGLVNIKRVSDKFDLKSSSNGTRLALEFNIEE